jgi:hypothetical protein
LNLDFKTRGLISETFNRALEEQSCLEVINWILEADDDVSSKEDLALGYVMGSLMNIAYHVASRMKLEEKLDPKYRKELETFLGKEEAAKILHEDAMRLEKAKAEGGKQVTGELTEEETDDIRNMLIPMIQRFREKIRKELAMRAI